jgi:hypothetical protein
MERLLDARGLVVGSLFLALLTTGFSAGAQDSGNTADLRVSSTAGNLRVEVAKTTPLTVVMGAVCRHEGMKCAGVQLLSSYPVPPMVVEGSPTQVVGDLLRGTGINFEFVHGIAGARSDLLLGTAPAGNSVQQASDLTSNEPRNDLRKYQYSTQLDTDLSATALPSRALGAAQAAGNPQPAATTNSAEEAAQQMFKGGNATGATPSAYLPFPDSNGNPIPAKSAPALYLPFPDQFGNPIPVQRAKSGSPFPPPPVGQANN